MSFWTEALKKNENNKKYKELPDGYYTVMVSDIEYKAPEKKNPYILIKLMLVENATNNGQMAFDRIYWHNEGCFVMAIMKMKWLGLTNEDIQTLSEPSDPSFISALKFATEGKKYTAELVTKNEFQSVKKLKINKELGF